MNDQILKAALSKLISTRDSLMIEINLLSDSKNHIDGIVNTLAIKITELSMIDNAIAQTQSFIAQSMAHKISSISKLEKEKKENNTEEK